MRNHDPGYSVRRMCRVMNVHTSGYCAWRTSLTSVRQRKNIRLLGLIQQFWLESSGVYGYSKVSDDMRDAEERYSTHHVYRLISTEGLRSQTGYRRCPDTRYSWPPTVVSNLVASSLMSPA